ncbi:MAG: AmmeMemoRadiSam system protein B [Kiritimatiellae bacterium]|jgi:AmmeMemoRadiSam system protein B|nr:AmmeMemoRadiSam system protein B [Kiritimatiellia bacterium]
MKNLKSSLSGQWYSDDARELSEELESYISNVPQKKQLDNVMAVLLPHAGYQYSGQVAAYGINQLVGRKYKRVIVLGPTHRVHMIDAVSIPDCDYIETPFGRQALDTELIEKLRKYPEVQSIEQVHKHEHSVQIELPMLQYVLDDFQLVPIVVGQLDEDLIRKLARILLENIDDETLVVVSSDFTHYGRSFGYLPFLNDIEHNLKALDMGAFRYIENGDFTGFLEYIDTTGATICGRYPIAILLAMLSEDSEIHLLKYQTSGHVTGDWSHCVSYVAAAVTGKWGRQRETV